MRAQPLGSSCKTRLNEYNHSLSTIREPVIPLFVSGVQFASSEQNQENIEPSGLHKMFKVKVAFTE